MSEGSDDDAVLESQVTHGGMACEDSPAEEIIGMDLDSESATSSEQLSDVDLGRPHLPVPPLRDTKAEKQPQIDRMPPFGFCSGDRSALRTQRPPLFEQFEPIMVRLEQVPNATEFAALYRSGVLDPSDAPTLRVYGTIRCMSLTHLVPKVLTKRNRLELPTGLGFDPEYKRQAPPTQKFGAVSPVFAEWLMGLPRDWTSVTPMASPQRPLQDCRFLSSSPGTSIAGLQASQQQSRRWKSISIFSGCGALDLGLAPWVEPLLYCEIDLAAKAVLRARMSDGSLPIGPIIDDVADVTCARLDSLPETPQVLVGGFPCQDICKAGLKRGLDGSRSGLFFEILRIIDACNFLVAVFLENVDAIRSMEEVWKIVLDSFLVRGFCVRWVSIPATAVGSPQRRQRWFFLARRGEAVCVPFADALPLLDPDGLGVSAGCPTGHELEVVSTLASNSAAALSDLCLPSFLRYMFL